MGNTTACVPESIKAFTAKPEDFPEFFKSDLNYNTGYISIEAIRQTHDSNNPIAVPSYLYPVHKYILVPGPRKHQAASPFNTKSYEFGPI